MATAKAARYNEVLLSAAGALLPNTAVTVRLANTTTPATLYTDENKGTTAPNPTTSDSFGNVSFWADFDSHYDLFVNGTTIQDVAVTPSEAALAGTFERLTTFNVKTYGATGDGASDDSTAVQAAITAAGVAGGVVLFPAGTYRINSQLVLPNNGASVPTQKPVMLCGVGAHFSGQGQQPTGGSILDLRYSGTVGKVVTYGLGTLEIVGLTFSDLGTSTTPYIYTTNTTLLVHHNAFWGNSTKSRTSCDQDIIILGGLSTVHDGTSTAPFQGYGTVIESNFFERVRRGLLFQTYANGVVVRNNTWWSNCGGAAAIELAPAVGQTCTGNLIDGNLIEMFGYVNGIKGVRTVNCTLGPNNYFDPGDSTTAYVALASDCSYDTVVAGFHDDTKTFVTDASNTASIINHHQSQVSRFRQVLRVGTLQSENFLHDGATAPTIQPAAARSDGTPAWRIRRSAAEATNPDTNVFQVSQDGQIVVGGSQAGRLLFQDAAGTTVASFLAGLKQWVLAGDGGAMLINSGTGGSYLTLQNFGVKLKDHTGANEIIIRNATGTPEGAFAAPVGSMFLRTDGGAGTTLYIKESGTGNVGWVAK